VDTFEKAKEISEKIMDSMVRGVGSYRILTGDRPTGNLHLGHYFGSLVNRINLQRAGVELFVLIADQQVLTDHDSFDRISFLTKELAIDNMSVGIDFENEKTFIFPHSNIPELNQLLVPFLTLVSVAELERNPTVKEEIKSANITNVNAGMLIYPVHQACDILSINANLVPVGKDQLPHLELLRVIARRFNDKFCPDKHIFEEPQALLSEVPSLLGLDGKQKMSKSRGNAIMLRATRDEIYVAVKKATTDSEKFIAFDPSGRPEVANLLLLASLTTGKKPEQIAGEIGDGGAKILKEFLVEAVDKFLTPIREKRKDLEKNMDYVLNTLKKGVARVRDEASATLSRVIRAMNMLHLLK
jgi:tryptophanyl-tRNA synthetase